MGTLVALSAPAGAISGRPVGPADADAGTAAADSVAANAADSIAALPTVNLDELVVTGVKAAVVSKGDTLEFNAGSFRTAPNAAVEDLLKKLPGVEVGSDGSITVQGKTVKKILVDGKEFFSDDPTVASRNLPSDIVEKVQVSDRKSDTARLTGIDDGDDETVINLTVKKGMNQGWFGTVSGGIGTDSRYEGNLNVNWFGDGNQVSIIGGTNNVNHMGFSDRGRGSFRDFGGNNGINTTRQLGLNFNVGNEEKFRIGGNLLYSNTDRTAISRSHTQYLFPDSVSTSSSGSRTRDRGHNLRADFRMRWNIDDYNTLEFSPRFSYSLRKSEVADTSVLRSGAEGNPKVNSGDSRRFNSGNSYELSGRLTFNHRFASRPGRSFSAMFGYNFSNTREHATFWNDIEYYLRQEDSETLFRYLDNHNWSNRVEGRLTWTEPLGSPESGNSLNFSYKISWRFNNADQLTYNLPSDSFSPDLALPHYTSVPDGAMLSDDLSNRFRNTFFDQELQVGFKRKVENYSLDAGLLFAPAMSKSEDLINEARDIPERWTWNVGPYARFQYKFSKTSRLSLHYRSRTSQPSMSQLQPVADVSDPLNIRVGNPALKPTFTQTLRAHFNSYDTDRQQSISAMLNGQVALNSVVNRTLTDPATGVRTSTYANANGNWSVSGMGMLNQPFRNKAWRFNARLGVSWSSMAGYINGEFNRSGNLNLSPSAGVTFTHSVIQITVDPRYSYSLATNTLESQPDRTTHSWGFNGDVTLTLPFGLGLSTDLNYSQSSGYARGFNSRQWLWNAELSYSVLSDKSLTFSVRAYDLLGERKNISRSVSANMISDNEYNDLSRYVMFGVSWKFNTMKKRKNKDIPEDFPGERGRRGGMPPGGMPPGGPGGPPPF